MSAINRSNSNKNFHKLIKEAINEIQSVEFSWIDEFIDKDSWAMAKDALCFIINVVNKFKPENILEFGSGLSTFILAQAAYNANVKCNISSIDHDPFFGNQSAQKYLEKIKKFKNCSISMQISSLVLRNFGEEYLPCYHIDKKELVSSMPIDLGVIDGPPDSLGGREGTLYQMMEFSKPGTLILLDDAKRKEERSALSNWKQNLGEAIEIFEFNEFVRGLAVIIIHKPVKNSELLMHKLEIFNYEIQSIIPPNNKLIVLGNDWWCKKIVNNYDILSLFIESHDDYIGLPDDDFHAIQVFDQMRDNGAKFTFISNSAFWWFDYYKQWNEYLIEHSSCLIKNDRFAIFKFKN